MPIHLKKAIQFVNNNGNSFQTNYLKSLLGGTNLKETLQGLAQFQNEDGGWIGLDSDYTGNVSSITCTMLGLGKLERLRVDSGSLIHSTIAYLKRTQKARGMWDETPDILDFCPPSWYYPKSTKNQIWFTNGILRYIVSRKPEEHDMIARARDYLRSFWDGNGFPGYDHNNWMGIVSFYNSNETLDREIWLTCLENVRKNIHKYDLADINWVLESLAFIKLQQNEPAAEKGLKLLMDGQASDGGFNTEYGKEHRVDTTIEALDMLAKYQVIPICF